MMREGVKRERIVAVVAGGCRILCTAGQCREGLEALHQRIAVTIAPASGEIAANVRHETWDTGRCCGAALADSRLPWTLGCGGGAPGVLETFIMTAATKSQRQEHGTTRAEADEGDRAQDNTREAGVLTDDHDSAPDRPAAFLHA